MYLITAKYASDAERKRIEHILDKWRTKMDITRPEGIAVIVDTDEVDDLILELYSRTEEKDNITFYNMERVEMDVERGERKIELKLREKRETVEKLLDFIMARQRAILKMELAEPSEKIYDVYSKKGKAEISIGLHQSETSVELSVRISGYGEAVNHLYRKLNDELKLLEG